MSHKFCGGGYKGKRFSRVILPSEHIHHTEGCLAENKGETKALKLTVFGFSTITEGCKIGMW